MKLTTEQHAELMDRFTTGIWAHAMTSPASLPLCTIWVNDKGESEVLAANLEIQNQSIELMRQIVKAFDEGDAATPKFINPKLN